MKQKMLEMVQTIVEIFLYFDEIWKIKKVGLKNMRFLTVFEKLVKIKVFCALTASLFRFHQNKKKLEQ